MVVVTSKKVLTNKNVRVTLAITHNNWLTDTIEKAFKDKNFEMVNRYLKAKCDEMKSYFIHHKDMINVEKLSKTCYQLEIVKYKKI